MFRRLFVLIGVLFIVGAFGTKFIVSDLNEDTVQIHFKPYLLYHFIGNYTLMDENKTIVYRLDNVDCGREFTLVVSDLQENKRYFNKIACNPVDLRVSPQQTFDSFVKRTPSINLCISYVLTASLSCVLMTLALITILFPPLSLSFVTWFIVNRVMGSSL
jgi:hypothetical protein